MYLRNLATLKIANHRGRSTQEGARVLETAF
jgi:hypothetical protein